MSEKLIEALERIAELNHGSKESAIACKALEEYRRTPAETVGREAIRRQDIAKCFESKLEIYLTLKERNELQEWCNQTIDNIMALQLPAPRAEAVDDSKESR